VQARREPQQGPGKHFYGAPLTRKFWKNLWISFLPAWPSNGINRVSLTTGTAATLMPESIGCSLAVSTSFSPGNEIGPGTSASRWPSCALVILRCWQDICPVSDAGTLPPVHTATALKRQQSTWCYSVQLTTWPGRISNLKENLARILDAFGTSWNGLGGDPPPWPGMREREKKFLNFFKWRILVYFVLLSDGGTPKRRGARANLPPSFTPASRRASLCDHCYSCCSSL